MAQRAHDKALGRDDAPRHHRVGWFVAGRPLRQPRVARAPPFVGARQPRVVAAAVAAGAGVERGEPHRRLAQRPEALAGARPPRQFDPRTGGQHADLPRQFVGRPQREAVAAHELVAEADAGCCRDGVLEDLLHVDAAQRRVRLLAVLAGAPRAEVERAVLGVAARHQVAEEVADLVARDREADADVDAAAVADGDAAVDADHLTAFVEQRPAAVAWVHRRVDLEAVRVDEHAVALAFLVAMQARDDAERHRRREVRRQQERIAHRQRRLPDPHRVAVAERPMRPRLAGALGQQAQHREVAARVDAEHHRFVQLAVGQADLLVAVVAAAARRVLAPPCVLPPRRERLHRRVVGRRVLRAERLQLGVRHRRRPRRLPLRVRLADDVVVGQHVAVWMEDHAAATAGLVHRHHRAHRRRAAFDQRHAPRFVGAHRRERILRACGRSRGGDGDGGERHQGGVPARAHCCTSRASAKTQKSPRS